MQFDMVGIDGDILLYSVAFATQKNIYTVWPCGQLLGSPILTATSKKYVNSFLENIHIDYQLEHSIYNQPAISGRFTIDAIIMHYKEKFKTSNIVIYLTGEGNFREKLAKTHVYKGNRVADKPINYTALKTYLLSLPYTVLVEGEEADDMLSKGMMRKDVSFVAVSDDKDLLNTPGYLYRPKKEELVYIPPEEALLNFYCQLLTGDSVDNIKGLPGVGPVGALKAYEGLLRPEEWHTVASLKYAEAFGQEEGYSRLLENGRLLWMRRKEGEIWEPENYFYG